MTKKRTRSTPETSARAAAPPNCEVCRHELVEINLLIDGEELTMRSCSVCDTRSWHRGSTPVELGGILADISSSPTRYRRDLANR
jgi:transcription elongation factor Elf1